MVGNTDNNNDVKNWAEGLMHEKESIHFLSLQPQPLESGTFPQEVVPATLANLFHFLARNEEGQCEEVLYPVIQQLFSAYPLAQQKLAEQTLKMVSIRGLDSISSQLLNISDFLDKQARDWVIQQALRIMFYRQWSDEKVRCTLKYLSDALSVDSQQMKTIIEDIHAD
ncbi:hypothetical protein [Acinetobacter sp. NIPH 2100]|uniref:hypothetical protein n=1 Tax=Acinetobacter sp. NIPH 2100 TaxID=1217708 RepID=UPI0002CE108D|nr:hypothetical protein [Acinetobacter sp. NIPH 2100]ENX41133.1 hypothetical protein F887_02620 [Acinetobacter sp. NIPH 2100]